jgi:hypothetical protein
VGKKKN